MRNRELIDRLVMANLPVGRENAIKSYKLTELTGLRGSEIRASVNRLRADFHPICSTGKGYYLTDCAEDIDITIKIYNSRIHKMIQAREGLAKAKQKMMMEGTV